MGKAGEPKDPKSSDLSAAELETRCQNLLNELDRFETLLGEQSKEGTVEIRPFRNAIKADLGSLQRSGKASSLDVSNSTTRSSNIPFYETVWETAKRSRGVTAFEKRVHARQNLPQESRDARGKGTNVRRHGPTRFGHKNAVKDSAFVDIIANQGAEWIKVSTMNETRLLFELARQGWECSDTSSSEDDANDVATDHRSDNGTDKISILRMAEDLARVSKATRVRYRHPSVRIVLPKLQRGNVPEIDRILDRIESTGCTLDLGSTATGAKSDVEDNGTEHLDSMLQNIVIEDYAGFSETLNIDCTILLALVSDISHQDVPDQPWFHAATRKQVEVERKRKLLLTTLYPAMGNRKLVCTSEAAARMREIVDTIGTGTERARTALLLTENDAECTESTLSQFASLSEYSLPKEWNIPIRVVHKDSGRTIKELPPLAAAVSSELSEINKSVFIHGWRTGRTTLTSNRTVAQQIEDIIETSRGSDGTDEEFSGPEVWLCPAARSLIGKDKNRRELVY